MFLRLLHTLAVLLSYFHAITSYSTIKSIRTNAFKLNFQYKISIGSSLSQSTAHVSKTKLHSLGTDLLERPEDENSPEFKEYLRQLMSMQVNRAKSGFAAPSSASSDAYLAKLNRIKLEKIKLRELGLPEDAVNTGYQPEDFLNAKYVIIITYCLQTYLFYNHHITSPQLLLLLFKLLDMKLKSLLSLPQED